MRVRIGQFTRTATGQWLLTASKTGDDVWQLESIQETIPGAEIFSRITFGER